MPTPNTKKDLLDEGEDWLNDQPQPPIESVNKQIEEIVSGVFLHGQETPKLSGDLPKGQYTIAEAINLIARLLAEEREKGRDLGAGDVWMAITKSVDDDTFRRIDDAYRKLINPPHQQ